MVDLTDEDRRAREDRLNAAAKFVRENPGPTHQSELRKDPKVQKELRKDPKVPKKRLCGEPMTGPPNPIPDSIEHCVAPPSGDTTPYVMKPAGAAESNRLPRAYEFDGLSLRQALERFCRDTQIDLTIERPEADLRLMLIGYFPRHRAAGEQARKADLAAIGTGLVRNMYEPERIAQLVAFHWPLKPEPGQDADWPSNLKPGQVAEAALEPDSSAWRTAYAKSRAKAVKRTVEYLEKLDKLFPEERKRTGSRRAIEKPNYEASVKKNLQHFENLWPARDLATANPPLTEVEYEIIRAFEYESYIDALLSAALVIREIHQLNAEWRASMTSPP